MGSASEAHTDPAQARRSALRRQLRCVERQLQRVLDTTDATAVHDLRVACRRASVILSGLAPEPATGMQELATTLATLRDESGPLRDLDVLIGDTLPRCAAEGGPAPTPGLQRTLELERGLQCRRLRARLQALQPHLDATATLRRLGRATDAGTAAEHEPLRRALRRLLRRGKRLRHDGEGAEHRLRVAVKKLRYALESAADLESGARQRWLRRCKRLQDDLGQLHDQAVAEQQLRERATSAGDLAFVEAFARWRADSEPPLRRRLQRRLRRLGDATPPWQDGA